MQFNSKKNKNNLPIFCNLVLLDTFLQDAHLSNRNGLFAAHREFPSEQCGAGGKRVCFHVVSLHRQTDKCFTAVEMSERAVGPRIASSHTHLHPALFHMTFHTIMRSYFPILFTLYNPVSFGNVSSSQEEKLQMSIMS